MGGDTKYMIIKASSLENAIHEVDMDMEHYSGTEFFDGYELDRKGACEYGKILSTIPFGWSKRMEDVRASLCAEMEEASFRTDNVRLARMERGRLMSRLGEMLSEQFCEDMVWFNLTTWDWSIPDLMEQDNDMRWYCVPVWLEW